MSTLNIKKKENLDKSHKLSIQNPTIEIPESYTDSGNSETDDSSDGFEDQGSSSEEEYSEAEQEYTVENFAMRRFQSREEQIQSMLGDGTLSKAQHIHVDDLSSDDEETRNTIGNVPLRWYDDYDHIGYDVQGKKIVKSGDKDAIDNAISAKDDPNFSRTIYDSYNDRSIVLSDRELEIIRRIQAGAFAHPEHNAYPEYVDYYTSQKMIHSLGNDIEPKSRFVPSKWEKMRILKIVKGIKEGRIKIDKTPTEKPSVYMLWDNEDDTEVNNRGIAHVPAPKMSLPGHAESYNPPEEYLFTPEEQTAWEEMDPEDRDINFIPKKFNSLREVAGYDGFVRDRFERCLDLYLCPRANKRRLNIDPESLVPQLPKPRDLRPFPNTLAICYTGHTGRVRSISMGPRGQYFASGSDDCTVRLWEVDTGRCVHIWNVGAIVHKIQWNPNPGYHVLAVASGKKVVLIATGTGRGDEVDMTNALLGEAQEAADSEYIEDKEVIKVEDTNVDESSIKKNIPVTWEYYTGSKKENEGTLPWYQTRSGSGVRIVLQLSAAVKDISWHYKGDYLATVSPNAGSAAVLIHQISKRCSQNPFSKSVGQVQAVAFHPNKPFIFHATQRYVRVYNLLKQTMVKKLSSGVKWISSISIHPSGDHMVIGSYDRRLCWFDLDLSSTPYKTLKYHEKAVRGVSFHQRYPLLTSASDDGTIHVFHSMVYSDFTKNPLIVPLKILRGHDVTGGLGVLSVEFHPTQPWVISGGADGSIRMFQNIH